MAAFLSPTFAKEMSRALQINDAIGHKIIKTIDDGGSRQGACLSFTYYAIYNIRKLVLPILKDSLSFATWQNFSKKNIFAMIR